ncbi:MAG: Asp-tRNA(Asn)/Glu-tRNA(Gln) amidotransferase subunit GatB [bacterium]
MQYETVIGLEVHAQVKTDSKIFCGCSTEFGAQANSHTCPVCTGMPGVLPVLNRKVVEYALRAAVALECNIAKKSIFARKQYFYPDLPKNYQISQYELPLAEHGQLKTKVNGGEKTIGIKRIHMEEDAGKLLHFIGSRKIDGSLVDFNRTGIPLIEIVSEPDLSSPDEAYAYLVALKSILEYTGVSDCDMEEGKFRCDANVSIRPQGQKELGVKAEVKNMNSFKNVKDALEYEINRQLKAVQDGERIVQETRLWDANRRVSLSMRSKEEAHDYRYFPEPDLVPLVIDKEWIEEVKKNLAELPSARKERLMKKYNLSDYDAAVLTADKTLADYYENCLAIAAKGNEADTVAKPLANWIMGDLLGHLNAVNKDINDSPISAGHLVELVLMIVKGTVSGKIAKIVFQDMFATGKSPADIVKEKNLVQVSDEGELLKIIEEVLAENQEVAVDFAAGKEKALGFLVGAVMKKSKGKANPQAVNKLLKEKLQ